MKKVSSGSILTGLPNTFAAVDSTPRTAVEPSSATTSSTADGLSESKPNNVLASSETFVIRIADVSPVVPLAIVKVPPTPPSSVLGRNSTKTPYRCWPESADSRSAPLGITSAGYRPRESIVKSEDWVVRPNNVLGTRLPVREASAGTFVIRSLLESSSGEKTKPFDARLYSTEM